MAKKIKDYRSVSTKDLFFVALVAVIVLGSFIILTSGMSTKTVVANTTPVLNSADDMLKVLNAQTENTDTDMVELKNEASGL